MAKKAKEVEVVKEQFVPEVVGEGVTRTEEKQNPAEALEMQVVVRAEGNWKSATYAEVASYEAKGLLLGFDPVKMEVLLKGE